MDKIRLRYGKTGKAKYISHLDLLATMRRALLRVNVELNYSEGFNPHTYMSVALPLPVGCGSECELLDFGSPRTDRLPDLPELINATLPDGLEIYDAYMPTHKFTEIACVEISGFFHYDKGAPLNIEERMSERFNSECIMVTKKTKRGMTEVNIAPQVRKVMITGIDNVTISIRLTAQNPTLNPGSILNAFQDENADLLPDYASFTREEIFDSEMTIFR